jgi:hypothetical protein
MMERERDGDDRGLLTRTTVVFFAAGNEEEMEEKSWSSSPRFLRLRGGQ